MTLDRQLVVRALPGYDLGDELGRGGWSLVLGATHRNLGRPVAVKVLPRAFAADPRVRARFHDEARIAASLHHPHIVGVLDFVEQDGLCLVVMERMQTESLWDRFVARGVTLEEACAFALATTAALTHAHGRGILHRDVKPENLLFSTDDVIALSDFGIAKVLGHGGPALTVTGSALGTPAYMSPEQVMGITPGPESDVYAVGVLLYELACGAVPFADAAGTAGQLAAKTEHPAPPVRDRRPDIHPALATTIDWALARAPEDRPRTMDALAHALAHAATEAFGPGWLRTTGIPVMASVEVLARTEHAVPSVHPVMVEARLTRSLAPHDRVGALPAEPVSASGTGSEAGAEAGSVPPAIPRRGSTRRRLLVALVAVIALAGGIGLAISRRAPAGPTIDGTDPIAQGVALRWSDGAGGGHLLIAYAAGGRQELPLDFSPREVLVPSGGRYCFVVVRVADRAVRSAPACINGGDAAVLVTD